MNLLDIAYLSLCVTSVLGAILFLGFTFRIRIYYPLQLVRSHVIFVVITFILFTWAFIQKLMTQGKLNGLHYSEWFLGISYLIFFVTFVIGMYFFLQFDTKHVRLRMSFVSAHLLLAGLTFIFFTSSYVLYLSPPPIHGKILYGTKSPRWYILHRNQTLQNKIK